MNKRVAVLCLLLNLAACAAAPSSKQYYLLHTPPDSPSNALPRVADARPLVIENIEFSSYLMQTGLVLQTAPGRMLISNHHLWAERLGDSIPKVLLGKLQQLSGDYEVYLGGRDWAGNEPIRVRLRIDNFHATETGEAIASGRFQIADREGESGAITRDFIFRRELQRDGYEHAIVQLRLLLGELAQAILEQLASLGV